MSGGDLLEAQKALSQHWQMVPVSEIEADLNRELLLAALEERILYLLKHNYNKLLTALYLLDIAEHKTRAAFALSPMQAQARALAELIYDRETEKIATRKKYPARPVDYLDDLREDDFPATE